MLGYRVLFTSRFVLSCLELSIYGHARSRDASESWYDICVVQIGWWARWDTIAVLGASWRKCLKQLVVIIEHVIFIWFSIHQTVGYGSLPPCNYENITSGRASKGEKTVEVPGTYAMIQRQTFYTLVQADFYKTNQGSEVHAVFGRYVLNSCTRVL